MVQIMDKERRISE